MSSEATPSAVDNTRLGEACAPFNDPEADLILRTSDGVDFRVYKLLLRLSSPFFKDMLSLEQPAKSPEQLFDGATPIIPVTETSDVMDPVLRFCYPFGDPKIKIFADLVTIADAMKKYQLVQFERMAKLFCSPTVLDEKPFQSFAVVCKLKMEEETKLAAFYTLRQRLPVTPIPELALITGLQYQQLLIYRHKCTEAVKVLIQQQPFRESHYIWDTCPECGGNWFNGFMKRLPGQLDGLPWPTALAGSILRSDIRNCSACSSSAFVHWETCIKDDLPPRFEEELRKVALEITF